MSHKRANELSVSRTEPEHISIIQQLLTKFYLHEITFLAHLNSIYSMYDDNRAEHIRTQLRLSFGFDHDICNVRALLDFFSNHSRQPQVWHHINIDQHLLTDASAHYMEPFITICPDCNEQLKTSDATKTMVYICCQSGKVLPEQGNVKKITATSLYNGNIVYIGGKYALERALIEQYTANLVTNANSWMKTIDSLNLQAFNGEQYQEHILERRTIARIMYIYNILQLDLFFGASHVELPKCLDNFDDWAWSNYPRLLTSFIFFWSRHKEILSSCDENKCFRALVIDGHQKCRRRVCKVKEIEIKTDLFDNMVVGCCRTPIRYSHYCELHFNENEEMAGCSKKTNDCKPFYNFRSSRFKSRRRKRQGGFGATSCRTIKERSDTYIRKCARSFGVIAAVTNCGIVITFGEIFRTETLKEILQLLTNSIKVSGIIPKTAVYDDGCHLIEYLHKHLGKDLNATDAAKDLAQVKFSVDRTHFRNHVGTWCRANMNPNDNPFLANVNTQAAEQLFSWLKEYAAIISSLGWKRASMFLLLLFHHKNLVITRTKPSSVFDISQQIPHVPDISLMHEADAISILKHIAYSTTVAPPLNQSCAPAYDDSATSGVGNTRKELKVQYETQQQSETVAAHFSKTNWTAQVQQILQLHTHTQRKTH